MKKSVAVLLVFAIVVGIGFAGFWLGRSSLPTQSPTTARSTASDSAQTTSPAVPNATKELVAKSSTPIRTGVANTPAPRPTSGDYQNAVPARVVQANSPSTPNLNAAMQAEISAQFALLETDDPAQPIQSPNVAAHQLVVRQAPDPDWSPEVNQALSDRLKNDIGNQIDLSSIDCRMDICEVQASGFMGGDQAADMKAFQKEIFDLERQGWFKQQGLQEAGVSVSGVDGGGPAVFLVFLTRT